MATIRRADPDQHREILAVTARAFWHDPLFDFFTRDLLHEYTLLPHVFGLYFEGLPPGRSEIWVGEYDGRPRGVAGWLPPGSLPRSAAQEVQRTVRAVRLLTHVRNRAKAARLLLEVDRRQPREPHWYLAILATDPTIQGRGTGRALLAPVLERCDRDGTVAHTETQKQTNVSWYARAGFDIVEQVHLPGTPHRVVPATRAGDMTDGASSLRLCAGAGLRGPRPSHIYRDGRIGGPPCGRKEHAPERALRTSRPAVPDRGGGQTGAVLLIDAANVIGSRPNGCSGNSGGQAAGSSGRPDPRERSGDHGATVGERPSGRAR